MFCLFTVDRQEYPVYASYPECDPLSWRNIGLSLAHGSHHAAGNKL